MELLNIRRLFVTYSEYRRSFESTEEFLKEFGKLSYDEARAIVSADQAPTHIKAAMMGTWYRAKEQLREKESK